MKSWLVLTAPKCRGRRPAPGEIGIGGARSGQLQRQAGAPAPAPRRRRCRCWSGRRPEFRCGGHERLHRTGTGRRWPCAIDQGEAVLRPVLQAGDGEAQRAVAVVLVGDDSREGDRVAVGRRGAGRARSCRGRSSSRRGWCRPGRRSRSPRRLSVPAIVVMDLVDECGPPETKASSLRIVPVADPSASVAPLVGADSVTVKLSFGLVDRVAGDLERDRLGKFVGGEIEVAAEHRRREIRSARPGRAARQVHA